MIFFTFVPQRRFLILILTLTIVWIVLVLILFPIPEGEEYNFLGEENSNYLNTNPTLEQNSFIAISSLEHIGPNTLGSLSPSHILWKIIKCESNFDPKVCNAKYGCRAGMGLVQLIPGTVRYCEKKLGIEIDPFDPEDNLRCGFYLLEHFGTSPWGTAETDWGSWKCFSKL